VCVWLEGDGPMERSSSCRSYLQRVVIFDVAHRWRQRRSSRVASFVSSLSWWWYSVMLCVVSVRCLCGVRFGMLCMIASSSSYMT
jgi:hypothetical protein